MPERPIQVDGICEVTAVEEVDLAGAGIGRVGDAPVHVRDLLPGERARVRIEHVSSHRPNRAWAQVMERLSEPAPERVLPVCPGHGQCGGCAWQHMAYSAQLEHKRARVLRALSDHGLGLVEVSATIAAPAVTGYRNVGKYVVAERPGDADDDLVLGSYAPRSHRVIDTAGCQIVEPVIDQVRALAARALRHLPVYDERARTGGLRYVTVRTGVAGTALIAVVTGSDTDRGALTTAGAQLFDDSRVSGVVWVRNDSRSGTIIDGVCELLYGVATVREQVAGVDIEVGVRDFFQVNRAQCERLYDEVARLSDWPGDEPPGDQTWTAIDAYCGVGGIAFTLARRAERRGVGCRIHGVERNPRTVENARRAAERAGLADILSFHAADAADMSHVAPALIVVNPPRKGLDVATRAALLGLAPARIAYVSCGPDSLARDLAALGADYDITAIQPIDLMPGTPQIETVVGLRRRVSNR